MNNRIIIFLLAYCCFGCYSQKAESAKIVKERAQIAIGDLGKNCIGSKINEILVDSYTDSVIIDTFLIDKELLLIGIENQYAPGFWKKYFMVISKEKCGNIVSVETTWSRNNESKFKPSFRLLDTDRIASLIDLEKDGYNEISILERVHNGTIYDALIQRIFKIDKGLNLSQILVTEKKTIHPINNCIIYRILKKNIVVVSVECDGLSKLKNVGSYEIDWKSPNVPVVSTKVVIDDFYEYYLLTGSSNRNDDFVIKGY